MFSTLVIRANEVDDAPSAALSDGSTSSLISQGLKSKPNRSSRSNIMAAALGISKASRSSHDTGDTLNNESFEKVLNGRWERALDIAAQHRSSTDLYTGEEWD
ncbi:hypothetical protein BSLG_009360 [Batrachochytrium salamandrivorans]|nr:hypothetical protein BSLG_009360 [Batrachochytrium salamandrivorans]